MKIDARTRLLILLDGRPSPQLAAELGVSSRRVRQIREKASGRYAYGRGVPPAMALRGEENPNRRLTWPVVDWIRREGERHPEVSLRDMADRVARRWGVVVCHSTVGKVLRGESWRTA